MFPVYLLGPIVSSGFRLPRGRWGLETRWEEGRLSATWRRRTFRKPRNGKCQWSCQINTIAWEKSRHASMSLWSGGEWGRLTSRAVTRKRTDASVHLFMHLSDSSVFSFTIIESGGFVYAFVQRIMNPRHSAWIFIYLHLVTFDFRQKKSQMRSLYYLHYQH